jgi:hypothetical protein
MIWVLVADITDEFILGLDILRRISGRGASRATTGPRRGACERSVYSVGVDAVATYR